MTFRKLLTTAVVLAILTGAASVASAEVRVLLALQGIYGDVNRVDCNEWIVCASFTHTIPDLPSPMSLVSGPPRKATGNATGTLLSDRRDEADMNIMKPLDNLSAKLQEAVQRGTRIPTAKLALCSVNNGDTKPFMVITMHDVVLSRYIIMAPGFGDRATYISPIATDKPVEILGITYAKADYACNRDNR